MKRSFAVVLILLAAITCIKAQTPQEPAYKRFPTVPPFTLLATDSSSFSRDDLPKHKKTLIMYFSPDCDHCKHQTEDILKKMDEFKKVNIIMATYQPFEDMVVFYKNYKLGSYPNIKVGRDTRYFFGPFYQVRNLPYLALYDAKGDLITSFEGTTPTSVLLDLFEKGKKLSK